MEDVRNTCYTEYENGSHPDTKNFRQFLKDEAVKDDIDLMYAIDDMLMYDSAAKRFGDRERRALIRAEQLFLEKLFHDSEEESNESEGK